MIRFILCFLLTASMAAALSPALNRVEPRGAKRGTEVTFTLIGERLYEPRELLLYNEGISVKSLEKGKDHKSAKVTLAIAPDCPLGDHPMRLRCDGGLTYMRTILVGQFETVKEARSEDKKSDLNNTFDQPQDTKLNVTIQGVADREDDDYYRVECKKGQRLSVEVEGMRLGRVMFDPYVAILDKNRFELAVSDDTALLKRDCATSILVPEDGQYTILVRESSYEGNANCQYRLHIGNFPRPTSVFPPAAKPGEEVEFTFYGDPSGPLKKTLTVPEAGPFFAFAEADGLLSPSGNMVHVSDLPSHTEPNNNHDWKKAFPVENPPSAPVAFHGTLSEPNDQDWFRFHAKKGQKVRIETRAREIRSPIDSVVVVRHAKDNKYISANDDKATGQPDSGLDFEAPADGDYLIQVTDKLKRGGADFIYRLEISTRQPSLSIILPKADRVDTQKNKMVAIPRGNRLALAPNISRSNIGCEVVLHTPNLPEGVSSKTPPIPRNLGNFPILFEASADAPISGGLYHLEVEDPKTKLRGPFAEKISHLYVNNQGDYLVTDTDRISIAVIEESPFHLDLSAPPVPIVQNGTMTLKVSARRIEGFTKKIKVTLPWKPPGITGPTEVDIPEGKNEASIVLTAKGDAPTTDWKFLVTGEAATDRGQVRVSSDFVDLKVTERFLNVTLAMAATNPGKDTNLVATIEKLEDFSGEATLTVHALPHGVVAKPQKVTSEITNLNIPLAVADDARKGKHSNLFCQVIVEKDGHPIPHNVGHGGILRIDPPPPAPKNKEKKPEPKKEAPVAKKEASKKPLSRLEQLRQDKSK